MAFRSDEIKVGIVVVFALAITVLGLIAVGTVALGEEQDQYTARFRSIGGLEPGSTVRYGGYKVGYVETVRLAPDEPTKVELVLGIKKGTPIKVDAVATISQIGFIGDLYLEIKPGTPEAALLPPGQRITTREAATFADLMGDVGDISADAKVLINNLNRTVETLTPQASALLTNLNETINEDNRRHLSAILRDASRLIHDTSPQVEALVANLRESSTRIDPLLDTANQLAGELRTTRSKIDQLIGNVDGLVTDNRQGIHDTITELQQALVRTQGLINDINRIVSFNQDYIDAMLRNFSEASDNLREFSETLAAKPSSIVFSNAKKPRKLEGKKTLEKLASPASP